MEDLQLRDYQLEVVQRAVRRENIIIWLPTGGGKTRASVFVAKRHLLSTPNAKVAVLVNKVHLVDQHHSHEFSEALREYKVVPISGDSEEKNFFGRVVRDSDLVICTAQILQNALINSEEDKHVELTDFTLLIIDECHHTNKDSVYNKIMGNYIKSKLNGVRRLPQILGLTASPGTGRAKTLDNAVNHVLQICANLDSVIVSTENYKPELMEIVPRPVKHYDIAERRPHDPFEEHLKSMMTMIHGFMDAEELLPFRTFGTQEYEGDVVQLEKIGVSRRNRLLSQCAIHLRKYNDALLINDTVRMVDALRVLEDFYSLKEGVALDGTDLFLSGLFQENHVELKLLASDRNFENPKLVRLEKTLLEQFKSQQNPSNHSSQGDSKPPKCIIFSKTRQGTLCLLDWVCANAKLMNANVKAAILIGAGTGDTHMTQNKQKDTISLFRKNVYNLLISTSVAEEGLDIPECNMVVRYGLLTNEIAQQQARGRARAENSVYSVVATQGSREVRREMINEYLEELTSRAVAQVQHMEKEQNQKYQAKIRELQQMSVISRMMEEQTRDRARHRFTPDQVQLSCRGCFNEVAYGSNIRVIENSHHVVINKDFKVYYTLGGQINLERQFEDWEPGQKILCDRCRKEWGMEIRFKKVAVLPCIQINSFSIRTPDSNELKSPKKWKDVPFPVEQFNFSEYARSLGLDLDFELDWTS